MELKLDVIVFNNSTGGVLIVPFMELKLTVTLSDGTVL